MDFATFNMRILACEAAAHPESYVTAAIDASK